MWLAKDVILGKVNTWNVDVLKCSHNFPQTYGKVVFCFLINTSLLQIILRLWVKKVLSFDFVFCRNFNESR